MLSLLLEKSKIKILQDYICYPLADVRKPDMTVMGDMQFCTLLLPGVNSLLWRTIFAVSIKISNVIDQAISPLKNLFCRNIFTYLKRPVYKIICSSIICNWKQNVNNLCNGHR